MRLSHILPRLPTAIVAGIDLNGLGVVRSLAEARIPTIALDTDLTKPTIGTRFGTKVRVSELSGKGFVDSLLDVARGLAHKPVLFLTQEDSVATVSAAREELASSYHFSMPSPSTMQSLMDKVRFQKMAEVFNCPIPRSLRLSTDVDVSTFGGLRFPCVIKPLTKDAAYGRKFAKAYKVSTVQQAAGLWAEMRKVVHEVIMQEWIEGEDSDVYFCLQYRPPSASPRVTFVGRKTCQWPPLVGGTASCVPAPEVAEELTGLTDAFFAAAEFVGLGSMEYKRDRRDGKFYMVEPTVGRTDYQEEIATLNGVNIPVTVYFAELGLAPPPSRTVLPPRAWRDPMGSYRAMKAGATDAIARVAPKAQIRDAYFRMNDPGPYLRLKCEPLTRRFSRFRSPSVDQ